MRGRENGVGRKGGSLALELGLAQPDTDLPLVTGPEIQLLLICPSAGIDRKTIEFK
jgi:hypothetical protein